MTSQTRAAFERTSFAIVGAIAGLAFWGLLDLLPDSGLNQRLILFISSAGLGFFGVLLALMGPTRLIPAAAAAAAVALPAAGLLVWASLRFAQVDVFLEQGHSVLAVILVLTIAVPYVAASLSDSEGWRDYAQLFDLSWTIVVRYAAAWLFVAVAWGVLLLSDALLGLVGITVIADLLEIEAVPFLISGLVLGLALAIVHELREYVSPFLLIQLLRLLLPVLLVVLGVFILALPLRGLSGLFGHFSAATVLGSVAFAGITLVTTAIHRDDEMAVQGAWMQGAAQVLALLLWVPAGLAVYAVWLRVAQYGLTPDRVAAMIAAVLVTVYALLYGGAVARRADWAGRIRAVNRVMAMIVAAVAVLWLTPVLNAQRLSVNSQLARAADPDVAAAELAVWEMTHDWGHAGRAGLEKLRTMQERPDHAALLALIDKAAVTPDRWQYFDSSAVAGLQSLDDVVPVRPPGVTLPAGALDALHGNDRQRIHKGCAQGVPLEDGAMGAGCVLVMGEFNPDRAGRQGMLFFLGEGAFASAMGLVLTDRGFVQSGRIANAANGDMARIGPDEIADLLAGRYAIVPVTRNALEVGGMRIIPEN